MIRWCHGCHLVAVDLCTVRLVPAHSTLGGNGLSLELEKAALRTYRIVPRKELYFLVYLLRGKLVTPNVKQLLPHAVDSEFASQC